jgi:hypothetical protein
MTERTADPRTGADYKELPEERGLAAQWVGLLLAPAAFFLHLQFAYAIVPWACRHQNDFWIHASGIAAVVLAAIGMLVAWRVWRRDGGDDPGEGYGIPPRARFLGVTGLGVSALITLILAAQWVAAFFISACE